MLKDIKISSKGTTLLEVLISISIAGTFLVALLSALSVGSWSTNVTDFQGLATDLAQNEMEYIVNYNYLTPPATYPLISTPPEYTINATSQDIDGNSTLSRITITVSRSSRVLVTLEGLKASP